MPDFQLRMPARCRVCAPLAALMSGGLSAVAAVCQVHGIAGTARGAVDGDLARGARRRDGCAQPPLHGPRVRSFGTGTMAVPVLGDLHQELLRALRRSRSEFSFSPAESATCEADAILSEPGPTACSRHSRACSIGWAARTGRNPRRESHGLRIGSALRHVDLRQATKSQCSGSAVLALRLPRLALRMPDESGSSDEEVDAMSAGVGGSASVISRSSLTGAP